MRKEVLYAVIFGIILGSIILYGINLANTSVSNTLEASKSANKVTPTPTPTIDTKRPFSIITPQDNSVVSDTSISLKGNSQPGSTVAVISENDDLLLDTTPEGTFSATIKLSAGINKIKVIQADKDHNTQSINLTVIQSDEISE